MRRVVLLALALMLAVGVAGCGSPSTNPDTNGTTDGTKKVVEVDPAKAEDLIATDRDLVVIDVSGRWSEGRLVSALDTPLDQLDGIIKGNYLLNASKHYLVYSRDEESSKQGAQTLLDSSFSVVYRLTGGFDAWVAYGGYVEQ
jgi:rhodanese-related sulfurtransferase